MEISERNWNSLAVLSEMQNESILYLDVCVFNMRWSCLNCT